MKANETEKSDVWLASEPAVANALPNDGTDILSNYDRIECVGPQSVDELMSDLRQVEHDMHDASQWDTLDHFLTSFKQSHAAWFE